MGNIQITIGTTALSGLSSIGTMGKLVSATVWKRDGEKCNETKVVAGTGVLVLPMFTRMGETEHEKMITVHYRDGVKHGPEIRYYPATPVEPNQSIWGVTTWRNGKGMEQRWRMILMAN